MHILGLSYHTSLGWLSSRFLHSRPYFLQIHYTDVAKLETYGPRAGASSHQQLIHLIPWPIQKVTFSRWATMWTRGESSAMLSLSHFLECPWCLFLLGAFSAPFCLLKYSSIYPHLQPHVHGIPSLCSTRFFPSWLAISFSFQLQS